MRTKFFTLLLFVVCAATGLDAQPRQAIVANGNLFIGGNRATVARYDLGSGVYEVFDSIGARFVQDVVIDGNVAFVAADSMVVRYNIDTYQREASRVVPGVRKLAIWDDKLIVTVGYSGTGDWVQALRASNLDSVFSIPGISGDCEGIVVDGDTAYVAVPGPFATPYGKLAVIDLVSGTLVNEVDYDTMGRGIDRVYLHAGKVWSVSPIAFAHPWSVVSEYTIATGGVVHHRVDLQGAASPGVHGDQLYLRLGGNAVGSFDLNSPGVVDTALVPGMWATGVIDTVRGHFLLTETDYFSYGRLVRYDLAGTVIDSVEVGISPEALAVDYRPVLGVAEVDRGARAVVVYPNPATETVWVEGWMGTADVRVLDATGRVVMEGMVRAGAGIDVRGLAHGVYHLRVEGKGDVRWGRFVR